MSAERKQQAVHEAITAFVADAEGQVVTKWMVVVEISDPAGHRWLAHRGGTFDGLRPQAWDALGMLEASVEIAREQLRDMMRDPYEDEDSQ